MSDVVHNFEAADKYAQTLSGRMITVDSDELKNLARAYLELRSRIADMPDNIALLRLGVSAYEDEFRALGLWADSPGSSDR